MRVYSIADAVDKVIDSDSYGAVEQARDMVNETSRLLARLLTTLSVKGLLNDADVIEILGSGWVLEGQPTGED
jgi:hypothetical protein